MLQYAIKLLLTSIVVVAVSEVAKRSSIFGALIASLPLTSLLAMSWLYVDTGDTEKVAALAADIFWLVLPSLVLFIALPLLLRAGTGFWPAMALSCLATIAAYFATFWLMGRGLAG